jgi:uncharacterized damage-inducible protein DinB
MELERIDDQLKRAFEGPAWHGPSVLEALEGVTAEQASARPIKGAHTIWEIARHITFWEDVVRRRISGETNGPKPEKDWRPDPDSGEEAWDRTLAAMRSGHEALRAAVKGLSDSRLGESVGSHGMTIYVLLHGAIQHDLYHAGQISILKKSPAPAAKRPASRPKRKAAARPRRPETRSPRGSSSRRR